MTIISGPNYFCECVKDNLNIYLFGENHDYNPTSTNLYFTDFLDILDKKYLDIYIEISELDLNTFEMNSNNEIRSFFISTYGDYSELDILRYWAIKNKSIIFYTDIRDKLENGDYEDIDNINSDIFNYIYHYLNIDYCMNYTNEKDLINNKNKSEYCNMMTLTDIYTLNKMLNSVGNGKDILFYGGVEHTKRFKYFFENIGWICNDTITNNIGEIDIQI